MPDELGANSLPCAIEVGLDKRADKAAGGLYDPRTKWRGGLATGIAERSAPLAGQVEPARNGSGSCAFAYDGNACIALAPQVRLQFRRIAG